MASLLRVANIDAALRITGHRHGKPLTHLALEEPTVLTNQARTNLDPEAQMVMDAKALYDALLSEQQNQDDERAALECSLIREDMEALGCRPRWVPHDKNPADALTKHEGAHFEPMARLLRTSRFRIREELEELAQRRAVKDDLGYNPRPRSNAERSSLSSNKRPEDSSQANFLKDSLWNGPQEIYEIRTI